MKITQVKIKKFSRITSTQEYAEKMKKNGENLIVTAARQSGGKGTKGRSFSSEKGGVYLSSVLYYPNFPVEKSFLIMAGTCAAVCRTLESGGLQAKIKWPNDVFVNGRKICGILTENTFSAPDSAPDSAPGSSPAAGETGGKHKDICSVCGIGLNVENELPPELENIATSVFSETEKKQSVKKWRERLIENLLQNYADLCLGSESAYKRIFDDYLARFGFVGENMVLVTESGSFIARVLGADECGRLRVLVGGEEKRFSAAEIVKMRT